MTFQLLVILTDDEIRKLLNLDNEKSHKMGIMNALIPSNLDPKSEIDKQIQKPLFSNT